MWWVVIDEGSPDNSGSGRENHRSGHEGARSPIL